MCCGEDGGRNLSILGLFPALGTLAIRKNPDRKPGLSRLVC
jgi:hypothetical protein